MDHEHSGERDPSVDAAVTALYDELRAVAARHLRMERSDHTLQPTALVHEAYLRLSKQDDLRWENRLHFLNIAAAQIRRILVDHARSRGRQKRGGDRVRVTLSEDIAAPDAEFDVIELDEALNRLDASSPEDRQIVELKFFGGLTEREIAAVLEISERTVRRRWLFARTWLFSEMDKPDP
jgi:RNA polymerase sigma factor (TIGR02999 family)